MKKKLFANLISSIAVPTAIAMSVVPVVVCTSNLQKITSENKVASINDVTVTFDASQSVDEQGNTLTGVVLTGKTIQTIKKGKEFAQLALPTATLTDAEFVEWKYSTDGSTWSVAHPYTEITGDMTIKAVFDITACNKFFLLDTSTGSHYKALDTASLCGDGNILYEDGTIASTRTTFNNEVYVGQKVTAIPDNFLSGCTSMTSKVELMGAKQLAYIGRNFMADCSAWTNETYPLYLGNCTQLQCIDDGFLSGCSAFNRKITFPDSITKIGNDFMIDCEAFNNCDQSSVGQILTLPASLTYIGTHFMENCKAYAMNLTVPASVEHVGESFMYDCTAFDGKTFTINCTADVFDLSDKTLALNAQPSTWTGITIAGTDKSNFKTLFPDSSIAGYCRKLNLAA